MCLAVPGRVIEVTQETLPMGKVDFGGVTRRVCLAYVPEARVGDYVLVHVGFALSRVDEEAARETLAILEQLGEAGVPDEEPDAVR